MSFSQQAEYTGEPGNIGPEDSFYGRPSVILLDEKQWVYIQRRYRMSPRELQVARLVCRGLTNGDMADKLKVKPGTVKTHLRSIFAKVHARNKITLLLKFIDAAGRLSEGSPRLGSFPLRAPEKPPTTISAYSPFTESE